MQDPQNVPALQPSISIMGCDSKGLPLPLFFLAEENKRGILARFYQNLPLCPRSRITCFLWFLYLILYRNIFLIKKKKDDLLVSIIPWRRTLVKRKVTKSWGIKHLDQGPALIILCSSVLLHLRRDRILILFILIGSFFVDRKNNLIDNGRTTIRVDSLDPKGGLGAPPKLVLR